MHLQDSPWLFRYNPVYTYQRWLIDLQKTLLTASTLEANTFSSVFTNTWRACCPSTSRRTACSARDDCSEKFFEIQIRNSCNFSFAFSIENNDSAIFLALSPIDFLIFSFNFNSKIICIASSSFSGGIV